MSPRLLRRLILIAVLILGGWGAYRQFGLAGSSGPAKAPPVPVSVAPASLQDIPVTLDGLGSVVPQASVTVRTQVDGQLRQVLFREGQDVKAGDVLVQIDSRGYQAQLDQASARKAQDEAQLANARRDLVRYQALLKNEYATRQQVDTTQAQVTQLEALVRADQAAVENARVLLGYTTIRSPIDGRAGFRQVDEGNLVHVNDANPVVVITRLKPITVVFTLPQDELPGVLRAMGGGAPLTVEVFSRDGRQILDTGRLDLVDNQIDPATGTVRLKALMPNEAGLLWPGQFISARLTLGQRAKAVTVPFAAVQRGQQGAYVYVVDAQSKAQARPVTVVGTGASSSVAVIESGLAEGEVVVTAGQMRLRSGSMVAAAPEGQPK